MPETRPPQLGDIIEAYCSRCRLNLDCNVAAVYNGQILKVECRTCRNFVAFKPPKDMEAKKQSAVDKLMKLQSRKRTLETKSSGKAAPEKPSTDLVRWQALTAEFDIRKARPYDAHRVYKTGEYVLHKKLGVGYVEESDPEADTFRVLFRDALCELEQNVPIEE